MPNLMPVILTWKQLRKLEQYIASLRVISSSPAGELKDGEGNVSIEWDESEVKFNLPE